MSFAGKNLTQGGQMTAYRWRMFIQVNNWIGLDLHPVRRANYRHFSLANSTGSP
jgi:hypothetical protein